jgi:hypothetical protein
VAKRWEYNTLLCANGIQPEHRGWVEPLDKMGDEGWELVSTVFNREAVVFIFKREVPYG